VLDIFWKLLEFNPLEKDEDLANGEDGENNNTSKSLVGGTSQHKTK
jgi:hypothetical protein